MKKNVSNESLDIFEKAVRDLPKPERVLAIESFKIALKEVYGLIYDELRGNTVYSSDHEKFGFDCDCEPDFKKLMSVRNRYTDEIRKEINEEIKRFSKDHGL